MAGEAMLALNGKRALITGSAEGIGFAAAKKLAAHGGEVWLHDKDDAEKCIQAATELGTFSAAPPAYQVADFEHPLGVETLVTAVPETDILVLNASMQIRRNLTEITRQEFEQQVNTNFWSALRLIQQYLPGMRERGWGRIITIGSVQEAKPHPQMAVYAALKAAVSNLAVNVALQVGNRGITVNNIAPGVIQTVRNEEALADAKYADQTRLKIPLGYFGEPNDCAGIALLLCSEAGRYITGQTIYCDGGMSIR